MQQARNEMVDSGYNPVIGYMLLDSNRQVIGPEGADIDPAFHTKQRALKAAEKYGREAEVHEVGEIYLEGIFNVIVWDQGDIMLDGQSAKRFVKACKHRGLKPSSNAMRRITLFVKDAKYSARELLGDMDLNRGILLTQP
jgi:hypothetical protein